jgi:hypothetical protein
MRLRDLRSYGLSGYVRTHSPKEAHTAYQQEFGHAPCPLSTLQYWYNHGLRELLPSEWISEVMDPALPLPEDRIGNEIEIEVTKQESAFPVIKEFPSIIATSKEAQAEFARVSSGGVARAADAGAPRFGMDIPATAPPQPRTPKT